MASVCDVSWTRATWCTSPALPLARRAFPFRKPPRARPRPTKPYEAVCGKNHNFSRINLILPSPLSEGQLAVALLVVFVEASEQWRVGCAVRELGVQGERLLH